MTTLRFGYQAERVLAALAEPGGLVINVGANEDPGHLKALDPERVVNCDLCERDQVLDHENAVDVTFDCARDRWPFEDDSAALIVLGDILEHLAPDEIAATLAEARRVSRRLCITVPEDHREECSPERADLFPRGAVHRTIVTETLLRGLLTAAGWTITELREVEYDSGAMWGMRTMGFFVSAE